MKQIDLRRYVVAAIAVAFGFAVAGCEQQQVTVYKQGKYQGKPDTKPWDNAPFSGNQADWERAIKLRNQGQNEYKRTS